MSEENLAPAENTQTSQILSSLSSKASAMAHNLVNKTRSFTDELKQHVGEGKIHESIDEGLKARIKYFAAFRDQVNAMSDDKKREVFKQDRDDVQIVFPEPAGMDLGNQKITKKEHLGGKFSKITVKSILDGFKNVKDGEFKKIHDVNLENNKLAAITAIKDNEKIKPLDNNITAFVFFLDQYLDELESNNIGITASKTQEAADAKTQEEEEKAKLISQTISLRPEQKQAIAPFSQILATNKYLPNLFLVFDKESKPKMYYYEHSITDDLEASGPSNYRDKLNGLFGKEGDESKIPIIDITKENSGGGGFIGIGGTNTGKLWPMLLQNKIKNVGDKGEVKNYSFDPGFNITKSVYKYWSKDTATSGGADGETQPDADVTTEPTTEPSATDTPTVSEEAPVNWTEWIDNIENQNKFLIRKEMGKVPTAPTDSKEKKAQMLWNLACYASQTVWRKYYDATKQGDEIWMDKMKDDLTNSEKMKNTWNAFLQADKDRGHFSKTKQVIKWEDALKKWDQEYAGCIGLGSGELKERLMFINAEGTIKTVDDSQKEYKIKQLDGDYKFKFTLSSMLVGGKRRRKSHRKSHKKTQKKHKKQMKKSHKKVHKKKTRGKKC